MDPVSLLSAGSSVLGKALGSALSEAPSTNYSGVGGTSSLFDASGFIVNFGSGTVNAKAGTVADIPRQAKGSVIGPQANPNSSVNWPVIAAIAAVAAYVIWGR
jgi:hypothetical protein